MAVNVRFIPVAPEAIFRVMADGWLYAVWVVGATRIRSVDADWPADQSVLKHSFGVWPIVLDDKTVCLEWDPPRRARLRAHGWPIGEAQVTIDVRRHGDGCVVRIIEDAVVGPGMLVPEFIRTIGLSIRNRETLHRLALLAEGGAGGWMDGHEIHSPAERKNQLVSTVSVKAVSLV